MFKLNPLANVFLPNKIEECWQYFLANETETRDMATQVFCSTYIRGAVCSSAQHVASIWLPALELVAVRRSTFTSCCNLKNRLGTAKEPKWEENWEDGQNVV